jgi:hypothetical protein
MPVKVSLFNNSGYDVRVRHGDAIRLAIFTAAGLARLISARVHPSRRLAEVIIPETDIKFWRENGGFLESLTAYKSTLTMYAHQS